MGSKSGADRWTEKKIRKKLSLEKIACKSYQGKVKKCMSNNCYTLKNTNSNSLLRTNFRFINLFFVLYLAVDL